MVTSWVAISCAHQVRVKQHESNGTAWISRRFETLQIHLGRDSQGWESWEFIGAADLEDLGKYGLLDTALRSGCLSVEGAMALHSWNVSTYFLCFSTIPFTASVIAKHGQGYFDLGLTATAVLPRTCGIWNTQLASR